MNQLDFTDLKSLVSELQVKYIQSQDELERFKLQRDVEMKTMLNLANAFQSKLDYLMKDKGLVNTSQDSDS